MAINWTFAPPVPPDIQSSATFTAKTLNAQFGDNYEQVARAGLNNVSGVYTVSWGVLNQADRAQIEQFFSNLGGAEPFYYTFPGESTARKFRCATWTRGHVGAVYNLRAEFREVFDL